MCLLLCVKKNLAGCLARTRDLSDIEQNSLSYDAGNGNNDEHGGFVSQVTGPKKDFFFCRTQRRWSCHRRKI